MLVQPFKASGVPELALRLLFEHADGRCNVCSTPQSVFLSMCEVSTLIEPAAARSRQLGSFLFRRNQLPEVRKRALKVPRERRDSQWCQAIHLLP